MSYELLLKNTVEVLVDPNKLKQAREDIENAECHFGLIDDKDVFLDHLIWMGPPEEWRPHTPFADKTGKVYEKIAPDQESRSLRNVAKRIQSVYSGDTPEQLLTALYQESDWFGRHLIYGTHLSSVILPPLWVRTSREHEKEMLGEPEWQNKLYIEDGNGRALVYALRLLYGNEEFRPVPVLWCKSWKHILCWAADPKGADQDYPPSELKQYFQRDTVDKYLARFKNLNES